MLEKICIFAVLFILYEIYWPEKLHMTYVFSFILPSFLPLAISTSVPNNFFSKILLDHFHWHKCSLQSYDPNRSLALSEIESWNIHARRPCLLDLLQMGIKCGKSSNWTFDRTFPQWMDAHCSRVGVNKHDVDRSNFVASHPSSIIVLLLWEMGSPGEQ